MIETVGSRTWSDSSSSSMLMMPLPPSPWLVAAAAAAVMGAAPPPLPATKSCGHVMSCSVDWMGNEGETGNLLGNLISVARA